MSKQKLTLVKVGGKVVEEKDSLQDLLARFAPTGRLESAGAWRRPFGNCHGRTHGR